MVYVVCTDEKEEEKRKGIKGVICQSQELTKKRSRVELNMLQYTNNKA